jgi:hypothetical protein
MRRGVRTVPWRAVAALIALQFSAGCSMALIQRAPPPDKRRPCFYCSQEMVLPAADGLVASLAFTNGVYALSKEDSDYAGKTLSQGSDLAISALITLVFAVSTGVGTKWILECRAAQDAVAVPAAAVRNPLGPPKRAIAPPAADEPIVAPVDPDPPGDDPPSVR